MNTDIKFKVTGEFTDTIRHLDGTVEIHEGRNLIVDGIYQLITSLFAKKEGFKGLQYWAIGSGLDTWEDNLPQPVKTDTRLVREIGRKAIQSSDFRFVDAEGHTSVTPTNRLAINVVFGYDECIGTWREFGIFGGNATDTVNSGTMINRKVHGVINKTREMEITREIIFTFTRA